MKPRLTLANYDVLSDLVAQGGDIMRRKGEQRGSLRRRGKHWFITFSEWRRDAQGNSVYAPTERRIEGSEDMSRPRSGA